MEKITAKKSLASKGVPGAPGNSNNALDALLLLADEQENIQKELLQKVAKGIARVETWISTWPEKGVPSISEGETDETRPFGFVARFKVSGGKVLDPLYIPANEYRPKDKSTSTNDPQRWIETATNGYLSPKQKSMIKSEDFFNGDQVEVPMAMSIFKVNQQTHSFVDANGKTIVDNVKSPRIDSKTKYIVFGRGKIGKRQYPITTDGVPGTGEKYLPDVFFMELTSDESAQAFLDCVRPESKMLPELLLTSMSYGVASNGNFDSFKSGDTTKMLDFSARSNPNSPYSPGVKFHVFNGSGLK